MEKQEPLAPDTTALSTNGHARPANLSSNLTLFWRVFLPVFGTVFFTGLLLAFWLTDPEDLYLPYSVWYPRGITGAIWVAWLLAVRQMLWPLKRVDADDAHVFITNYWVTVRYPWTDIAHLQEIKRNGRRLVELQLKAPGRFGQTILFLPGSHYREWMQEHAKTGLLLAN
ncbi:MAG: hypothetical protein IPH12_06935 [Saprospirales bacterium]|jgi:hypothetical protein|nr:hypothetical protein [Saprospirales bacterium]MBK8922597.1 hypothetical protein [Saprospirales bacterium]